MGSIRRRLDPANLNDVLTCDQGHNYNAEQKAFDGGLMDKFPSTVGNGGKNPLGNQCSTNDVMNYYDGNTVTGLWNYAQNFAMSDNSFGTTFGPSAPGAVNLISGDTGGVGLQINGAATNGDTVADGQGGASLIEDPQPYYDDCSTRDAVSLTGQNIGDELNAAGLSWGWFQGGFRPTTSFATATAANPQPTSVFTPDQFKGKFAAPPASDQGLCNAVHPVGAALGGTGGTVPGGTNYGNKDDYIAHHEPFQYYASTANPHHLPVASLAAIGTDTQTVTPGGPQWDTANHNYDMSDFDSLVAAIAHGYLSPDHLPAVSFLKAPGYQDGHAAYSDPIDEQQFLAQEINALQDTPDWSSTAVVVAYDDSDGWYDHVYSGVHNPSNTAGVANPPGPQDFLNGVGICGQGTPLAGQNGRCGFGPRLPLLVISPWARAQLRRPHPDQPSLDHPVHRGQLGRAPHPRFLRRHFGNVEQPVRLRSSPGQQRRRCSSILSPASPPGGATERHVTWPDVPPGGSRTGGPPGPLAHRGRGVGPAGPSRVVAPLAPAAPA